jgi:hypothetical protein
VIAYTPEGRGIISAMKSFATTIGIQAKRETVWGILCDVARWPEWNTTVTKVEGECRPGGTVTIHTKLNPGRTFPVTVREFTPPSRMVWGSGMPLGLFKGERTYTLTAGPGGGTEFAMREAFTGPLSGLIGRSIPDMQPAFEEFAACLKTAAEAAEGA